MSWRPDLRPMRGGFLWFVGFVMMGIAGLVIFFSLMLVASGLISGLHTYEGETAEGILGFYNGLKGLAIALLLILPAWFFTRTREYWRCNDCGAMVPKLRSHQADQQIA